MMEITYLPKSRGYIKGVINLRGKIIPVMDLRIKFGMAEKPYSERTCIIVIEANVTESQKLVGFVVDTVTEVLNIQKGEIEVPSEYGAQIEGDFLMGIGKLKAQVILILDIEKILGKEEIALIKKGLTMDPEKRKLLKLLIFNFHRFYASSILWFPGNFNGNRYHLLCHP